MYKVGPRSLIQDVGRNIIYVIPIFHTMKNDRGIFGTTYNHFE